MLLSLYLLLFCFYDIKEHPYHKNNIESNVSNITDKFNEYGRSEKMGAKT